MLGSLRNVLLGCSLSGVLVVAGCGVDPAADTEKDGRIDRLYGGLEGDPGWGYWNTSPWDASPAIIRVCWENPTAADASFRGWVQEAVERTWQRYARVNFNFWGTCSTTTVEGGVHILLQNQSNGRIVPLLGSDGKAHVGKFALDGRRAQLNPAQGMWLNPALAEATARNVAVHEFGHSLGFWHEESRPDSPNQCGNPDGIMPAAGELGFYDTGSVMSYCGGQAGGLQRVSANDIASVQRIYGRRILGQIVSPRGNCMAANSWTTGLTGVRPFLWTCDEFANDQEWKWKRTTDKLSLSTFLSSDTTHEAALTMVSATNNTNIEIRDYATSSLQWTYTDVEVRGYGAKCLTYPGTLGAVLTMTECSSRANPATRNGNQRWDRVDSTSPTGSQGLLRLTGTNTCVTVPNPSASLPGQQLITASCTAANAVKQQFFFANAGAQLGNIQFPRNNPSPSCWDVSGPNDAQFTSGQGGPNEGAPVGLYFCTVANSLNMNQQWNFTGQLRALGKCMGRVSGGDGLGTRMQTQTCTSTAGGDFVTSSATQEWDIYWQ